MRQCAGVPLALIPGPQIPNLDLNGSAYTHCYYIAMRVCRSVEIAQLPLRQLDFLGYKLIAEQRASAVVVGFQNKYKSG